MLETIKAFELKPTRAENIEAVKALQKQWLEIGFVPVKFKDEINTEYRNAVDAIFDKMRVTTTQKRPSWCSGHSQSFAIASLLLDKDDKGYS